MKLDRNVIVRSACAAAVCILSNPAWAADFNWSGAGFAAGSNSNADNPLNYQGNVAPPVSGASDTNVTFGNIGDAQHLVYFSQNTSWRSINFAGNELYVLTSQTSSELLLSRGISQDSTASQLIALPIKFTANQVIYVRPDAQLGFAGNGKIINQGYSLALSGGGTLNAPISGTGGLLLNLAVKATLGGDSTYTGDTIVYNRSDLTLANGSINGSNLDAGFDGRLTISGGGRFGPASGAGTNQLVLGGIANGGGDKFSSTPAARSTPPPRSSVETRTPAKATAARSPRAAEPTPPQSCSSVPRTARSPAPTASAAAR